MTQIFHSRACTQRAPHPAAGTLARIRLIAALLIEVRKWKQIWMLLQQQRSFASEADHLGEWTSHGSWLSHSGLADDPL